MAFDLNFKGAPICYSWPSHGQFSQYMADEAAVEWTIQHFQEFILKCLQRSGVKEVHLVAHSMGNRALAHSLRQLSTNPSVHQRQIHQIILAAPDIDRGVFAQIARDVSSCGKRTTLYASSTDRALAVSQQFHAYPRAGEAGDNILLVTDVDTIDASFVESGFLGHSYYGGRTALTDIYELITHGSPPPRFALRPLSKQGLTYWLIQT
jgi:esterase/lipase superfamily enzyme